MKKLLALFLCVCIILGMSACAGGPTDTEEPTKNTQTEPKPTENNAPPEEDTIVFGLSCAITGNFPLAGERTLQGVKMAVDEINAAGGVLGKKLDFIYEDDGNDSTTAINVVTKLINSNVVGVIGPHTTGNTLAVQQLYADAGIPFLSGGSGVKLESDMSNPYFHRVRPSDGITGIIAADFAVNNLGATKVGIDYNNNDFGTGGRDVVVSELKKLGVEYVEVAHNSGDTDMTAQLMELQAAGVDCVILWTDDAEDVITARQAYELGMEIPFVTSAGFIMQQVLDQMEPEYAEGWYTVTDFCPNNDDPVVKEFVERFTAIYGIAPELYASAYYGAVYALAEAITIAGSTDHEAVNEAFKQIEGLAMPTGTMTFEAPGNLIHSCVITRVHDLTASVVDTVSTN